MIEGAPVNVLDYGAIGDGVANDTAAIQAAIDADAGAIYF
ncbi:MAG: glycosyl hydrolase family 28-related protein, partial [Bacteroidota bacterium]